MPFFTVEHRSFIVKKWYELKSAVAVRRAFRWEFNEFHGKNLPSTKFIKRVVDKFSQQGTVHDLRFNTTRQKRKSTITDSQVLTVRKFYLRRQRVTLRSAARKMNLSRYKVEKILKKYIKKRGFKARRLEKLSEAQKLRRVTQVKILLSIPRLLSFLKNVWWTDESWFTSDGIAQKKDIYYWALSRDAVKPIRFQKHPTKVQVWAAISVQGVIGPYFFHHKGQSVSVNQLTYQTCVKWFITRLKSRRKFKKAVFMQDGATPHTALTTREFLKSTFGNRIIGKHFDKEWPPYSPDLTPADFYLWPTLKKAMYTGPNPYKTVRQLKKAITFNFKKLQGKQFHFLPDQIVERWNLCIKNKGDRW